jgi:hypothetical protein
MQTRNLVKWAIWGSLFVVPVLAGTISRTTIFQDGAVLTASQLNQEFNTVYNAVNSLDDANLSATANINPSKIAATIKGAALGRDSGTGQLSVNVDNVGIEVNSDQLRLKDAGVTTTKLANNSVTRAKIAVTDQIPAGSVQMFHTFNGAVAIPRGWMRMDGSVVNTTNYEAIHGAGTAATDGLSSSPLLAKNLPSMTNRYAVGSTTTTQDGSSAITAVGNSGNTVNLSHTHSMPFNFGFDNSGGLFLFGSGITFNQSIVGPVPRNWQVTGTATTGSFNVRSHNGSTADATTNTSLSSSQSIQPDSIQLIYIIKVI